MSVTIDRLTPVGDDVDARSPLSDRPEDILSAWMAMEVLSPNMFKRPEDLVKRRFNKVEEPEGWVELLPKVVEERFSHKTLPWQNGGEKNLKSMNLYYEIILGVIDLNKVFSALRLVYPDNREERPQANPNSMLATIMVDWEGRLVKFNPVDISSFGWGFPIALNGGLRDLDRWLEVKEDLVRHFPLHNHRSLNAEDIFQAYDFLIEKINFDKAFLSRTHIILRKYQSIKKNIPEKVLLNSFFLEDIYNARKYARKGELTANMRRYLGLTTPEKRRNLMEDTEALSSALEPSKYPSGAWPAKGRHPLVTLQQCAVNLATHDLKGSGVLAVNGPPGTGKTTLLRDIVAAIVTERATAMCEYDNPENAFAFQRKQMTAGNSYLGLYRLDKVLKGHEIVVASSNNKAVENVSEELPSLEVIDDEMKTLRYFKTVSDNLLDKKTWGAIAAVLGNSSNRKNFREKFWWSEDSGLRPYLLECVGVPQHVGKERRKPKVVTEENPPRNANEALKRWREAKQKFEAAKLKADEALNDLQDVYKLPDIIKNQRTAIKTLDRRIADVKSQWKNFAQDLKDAETDHDRNERDVARIEQERALSQHNRPGFWWRLWRFLPKSKYKLWRQNSHLILSELEATFETMRNSKIYYENIKLKYKSTNIEKNELIKDSKEMKKRIEKNETNYEKIICKYKESIFISDEFFNRSHDDMHTATPWLDKTVIELRYRVFKAAMDVHRAFIDAAAKSIRHNLQNLMNVFNNEPLDRDNADLLPDLWATLFLVTPVASTTFASISRMFERIPPETFGWLLIDEAGQATPQAAVGALMRTRRAVVVGDPMQVQPVVVLPESLTEAICQRFDVDSQVYTPPRASAQILADRATAYFGSFESDYGARDVGAPLLVHRRCDSPMFDISNDIAYGGQMIQAKYPGRSSIVETLGRSHWIDVPVGGVDGDKWNPKEGEIVIQLLRTFRTNDCPADLYIVTPFVRVQEKMRRILHESGVLKGWVKEPSNWPRQRVGTVHTVQGREAEAVIIVLGAPNPSQKGSRNWAARPANLLNVALTRAKEAVYVVGNRELWKGAGVFGTLDNMIDKEVLSA